RSKWKINELAIGKCSILEGRTHLDEEYVYVYFQPFKGYGWIFPFSKTRFNIGIFTFGDDNLNYNINELYQDFLNSPCIKKFIPESNYRTIWSGSYPFPAEGVLEKSLYDDNLMLIGDTAGFISPISGEGIQTAVISGRVAAKTAIDSLEKADYSRNILKKFKTNLEIKNIVRNFKLKRSMIEFFFENEGQNLNKMLQLTESDPEIKDQVVNMFAFGEIPSKDLISKIIS
ncbi:MAG: NAD(P)/FAD-dependent oxidoreductase, partial [Candidatus Thorarchaeota archaeon]